MIEKKSNRLIKEEIRGLFILGLLAVVASIRVQYGQIQVSIGELPFNITALLDLVLVSWSFYAFFMVLGASEDVLGETLANVFRGISVIILATSYSILTVTGIAIAYIIYPTRLPWIIGYLGIPLAYWVIKKVYRMKRRFTFRVIVKNLLQLFITFLLTIYIIFFFVIIICSDEAVIPSIVIGSVALVIYLVVREKYGKLLGRTR